jgi:hypothetical protein
MPGSPAARLVGWPVSLTITKYLTVRVENPKSVNKTISTF